MKLASLRPQPWMIVTAALLLNFVVGGVRPTTVQACSPRRPDPWFIANVLFSEATLPTGVTVVKNGSPAVYLHNASNTPLYLVEASNNGASFPNTELPVTVRPQYKLESGKAYHYDYSVNTYKRYPQLPENDRANTHVELGWFQLNTFGATLTAEFPFQDDRPNDVAVPPDEPFAFTAYSGTRPIQIGGTFRFTLNPDYDPRAGAKGYQACARFNASSNILRDLIGVIILVALVGGLTWFVRHRRKNTSSGIQ